jgi:tagatose 6-phosphate kinase
MILVLCLNAAVDKTARVRRFVPHGLNRLEQSLTLPGGKGVNVARALSRMGERPMLLGFTAGYTGTFIEDAARAEGLRGRWIRLPRGQSRICLSILDGGAAPTEANEAGPRVEASERARLEREFRRLLPASRLVILSGSLPAGCPPDTYARLVAAARRAGRPALVDTSGPALRPAVAAGPELVKLNADEAASLGLDAVRRPRRALNRLLSLGARQAAVTLGPRGAVAALGGETLRALPPKVRVLTPVGCGDTFLAGLARSLSRGGSPEKALAYASAVATASCTVAGAGVFRPRDASAVLRRTRVSPLEP